MSLRSKQGRLLVQPLGRAVALPLHLNLVARFALFCLVILVAGALVIGAWVSREIRNGVIERSSAVTALYVESFVRPHLTGLESGSSLTDEDMAALSEIVQDTSLGRQIVLVKVWARDGSILWSSNPQLIGLTFPLEDDLKIAFSGRVDASMSDLDKEENRLERVEFSQLIETYSPVKSSDGEVIAAVELYQLPDDLLDQVHRSQRRGWLLVGAATVGMYLLLVGLVTGASGTITRQNKRLRTAFEHEQALQRNIRRLNEQLHRAAGEKAQTDEELLRRVAQDLHDGAAQDLALALLRLESLDRPDAAPEERANFETIRFALDHSLREIRDMTTDLRLPQLDGLGWWGIVEKAAAEHRRRTGDVVAVEATPISSEPQPPQRIALYRVIQEALSNASRHAAGAVATVRLRQENGTCVLTIADSGPGFDPAAVPANRRRARLGLQGMRERVELLGGSFSIDSKPGEGTTIEARLPLGGPGGSA
jgi:signal transduction histidine kinase